MDDIVEVAKNRYSNNFQEVLERVVTIYSAIWSLDANRKQDKEIDNKIKKIIAARPDLDY